MSRPLRTGGGRRAEGTGQANAGAAPLNLRLTSAAGLFCSARTVKRPSWSILNLIYPWLRSDLFRLSSAMAWMPRRESARVQMPSSSWSASPPAWVKARRSPQGSVHDELAVDADSELLAAQKLRAGPSALS